MLILELAKIINEIGGFFWAIYYIAICIYVYIKKYDTIEILDGLRDL